MQSMDVHGTSVTFLVMYDDLIGKEHMNLHEMGMTLAMNHDEPLEVNMYGKLCDFLHMFCIFALSPHSWGSYVLHLCTIPPLLGVICFASLHYLPTLGGP